MNQEYLRNVVEAALLAAGRPLTLGELAQLWDEGARPPPGELQSALGALQSEYQQRALELKQTASGYRIQIRRAFAGEIGRLWPERPRKYSRALLETLALIAYRQPITRAEIEAVRGVAVNADIVRTLLERGWIRVLGTRDLPGRPELLGTTREFLDYFGLQSLDNLPALTELIALGDGDPQLELPGTGERTAATLPADDHESGDVAPQQASAEGSEDADDLDEPAAGASTPVLVAAPREDAT